MEFKEHQLFPLSLILFTALLLSLIHCDDTPDNIFYFKENFIWGTTLSTFFAGGAKEENNITQFIDNQGWEPIGIASNFYNTYQEDLSFAASLQSQKIILILDWSYIEPQKDLFNEEAILQYDEIIQACLHYQIEPILVLYENIHPLWLENEGGISSPLFPVYFGNYTEFVVDYFKERIDEWITFYSPMDYLYKSFITGEYPNTLPNINNFTDLKIAAQNLVLAHFNSLNTIKTLDNFDHNDDGIVNNTGIAKLYYPFYPSQDTAENRTAVNQYDLFYNFALLNALIHKESHEILFGMDWEIEQNDSIKAVDFLGINYLSRAFITMNENSNNPFNADICFTADCGDNNGQIMQDGRELYPKGISIALEEILSQYNFPVYITGSGCALPNGIDNHGLLEDYLKTHLQKVLSKSYNQRVKGFFQSSLIDQYVFNAAYNISYGLLYVDRTDYSRSLKIGADLYRQIIQLRTIPD